MNRHVILSPRTQGGNGDMFENLCTHSDLENRVSLCTTGVCLILPPLNYSCDPLQCSFEMRFSPEVT